MKSLTHLTLKLLVGIALTAIANTTLFAQPPDILWSKNYGGNAWENAYSMLQSPDGGYVLAGRTYSYGAGSGDFYLFKTDEWGNLIWQHAYGTNLYESALSVKPTADGGYILAGVKYAQTPYDDDIGDFYVVKTDSLGNSEWQRAYTRNDWDNACTADQTSDGGYFIVGTTGPSSYSDIYLLKTNSSGDTLWTRTYSFGTWDYCYGAVLTDDNSYVIAGATGAYFLLMKIDEFGTPLWTQIYTGLNTGSATCVQKTTDDGFILIGNTGSGLNTDFQLIKTDHTGNLIWENVYGGNEFEQATSVFQTEDGGYIMTGYRRNSSNNFNDVYLVKADASGNEEWERILGGDADDEGDAILQTSDGGYMIAGSYQFVGNWSFNAYLVKTDAGGVPLNLTTSPITPPITIPANGGSFQYNINVHNWTTTPQTFQIWNKVRNSVGQYTQVFGPISRTLGGGANPTRVLTQSIAGSISSGTLYFISYIGTYPNTIVDSSYFTITKSTASDGSPWISESGVTGDLFDEYAVAEVGAQDMRPSGSGTTPTTEVIPNPFNPTTTIRFTLSEAAKGTLEVFDINGRRVYPQQAGTPVPPIDFLAGTHAITFDGSGLPSGIYVYRLTAGEYSASGKMVLLK